MPLIALWNLTWERQIGTNWLVAAAYVGNEGRICSGPTKPAFRGEKLRFTSLTTILTGPPYLHWPMSGPGAQAELRLRQRDRFSHQLSVQQPPAHVGTAHELRAVAAHKTTYGRRS